MNDNNVNENKADREITENQENVVPAEEVAKEPQKQSLARSVFDFFEMFVLAAAAVMLIFTFSVRLCRVDGNSMLSTLENDQLLVVSDVFYTPAHEDIVVFHQDDNPDVRLNKPLVKRVIATEGEYYRIVYVDLGGYYGMKVYVSDDPTIDDSDLIDESYLDSFEAIASRGNATQYFVVAQRAPDGSYYMEGRVPDGHVFVMGDNRYNSNDSRVGVGFVDTREILGKVVFRISPFGTVK